MSDREHTRARLRSVGGTALVSYVERVVAVADELLEGTLAGAAIVGSIASGDVREDASDLDVLLVADRLDRETLRRAGERLADLAADCPLRGLEAVVYDRAALARPRFLLPYLLNVNGGRAIARLVSTEGDPAFWFLLDVAAAREPALVVTGPPPRDLIGPVPREDVLRALRASLDWHERSGGRGPDAVLNACRARCWIREDRWRSKTAAGEWVQRHLAATPVVAAALASRRAGSDADLDADDVAAFAAVTRAEVQERLEAPRREPPAAPTHRQAPGPC